MSDRLDDELEARSRGLTASSAFLLAIIMVIGIFALRCNGQKHCADSCEDSYTVTWPLADCICE